MPQKQKLLKIFSGQRSFFLLTDNYCCPQMQYSQPDSKNNKANNWGVI